MDNQLKSDALATQGNQEAHRFTWYLRWGFLLFLLYVLSTGPAFRVTRTNPALQRSLVIFYSPLILVSDACRPIDQFLDWYVKDVWSAYGQVEYQRMND